MNTQKIALFGNPGETSRRLITEAIRRGHIITAIVPEEKEFAIKHPNLKVVSGNVKNLDEVSRFARGHDAVVCAHEPTPAKPHEHVAITRSVIEGVKDSGVHRLIYAAHPFGQPSETTEKAYNEFKPILKAQQEALRIFQNEKGVQWSYIHSIEPVENKLEPGRVPKYSISDEILLTYPEGESRIPSKGYTSAIIDEAEKGEMELHGFGEEEERED